MRRARWRCSAARLALTPRAPSGRVGTWRNVRQGSETLASLTLFASLVRSGQLTASTPSAQANARVLGTPGGGAASHVCSSQARRVGTPGGGAASRGQRTLGARPRRHPLPRAPACLDCPLTFKDPSRLRKHLVKHQDDTRKVHAYVFLRGLLSARAWRRSRVQALARLSPWRPRTLSGTSAS